MAEHCFTAFSILQIIDKYDRQLRLWGPHGQRALMHAHILLINADGTGTGGLLLCFALLRFALLPFLSSLPSNSPISLLFFSLRATCTCSLLDFFNCIVCTFTDCLTFLQKHSRISYCQALASSLSWTTELSQRMIVLPPFS